MPRCATRMLLSYAALLLMLSPQARAAKPDEATAIVATCGKPLKTKNTVDDGGQARRLVYREITLHFRSVDGIWRFRVGEGAGFWIWDRQELARRLPCFRQAEVPDQRR